MIGNDRIINDLISSNENRSISGTVRPGATNFSHQPNQVGLPLSGTVNNQSRESPSTPPPLPPHRSYPPASNRRRILAPISILSTIESSNYSGSATQSDFSADNVFTEGDNLSDVSLLACANNSHSSLDLELKTTNACITKPVASVLPNINKSSLSYGAKDDLNRYDEDGAGAWSYGSPDPSTVQNVKPIKSPKPIRYWYIPQDDHNINTLPKSNKPAGGHLTPKIFIAQNIPSGEGHLAISRELSEKGQSNLIESTSSTLRRKSTVINKGQAEQVGHSSVEYSLQSDSKGFSEASPTLRLRHSGIESTGREELSELRLHQLNLLGAGLTSGLHAIASLKSPPYNVENKIYDRHARPQPPPRPPPLKHQHNISSFGAQDSPLTALAASQYNTGSLQRPEKRNFSFSAGADKSCLNRVPPTLSSEAVDNEPVPQELHNHLQTCRCTCNHLGYGNYQVCSLRYKYFIIIRHIITHSIYHDI